MRGKGSFRLVSGWEALVSDGFGWFQGGKHWFQMVSAGFRVGSTDFRWFRPVSGRFGWFRVILLFSNYHIQRGAAHLCEGCRGNEGIVLRVCKITLGNRPSGADTGRNNLLV